MVIVDQTDKSKVHVYILSELEIENIKLTEDQLEAIEGGGQIMCKDLANTLFPSLKDCKNVKNNY